MTPAQAAEALPRALAAQDWPGARKALARLLRADPKNASLHYNLGLVLRRMERPEDALAAFGSALKHAPDHVNALFEKASAQMELGRIEEAEAGFAAYTARVADDADGWLNLARLRLRLDRAEGAAEAFARASTLRKDDMDARIGAAEAKLRLGQDSGLADLRALHGERPDLRARLLKAMTQGPRGRIPLASQALTRAASGEGG
ncbi:tetratricopeptide repeat protein [Stappia sp.]|uniref:tetratricopeptide repeat protein n=1 Tax=Stappia sp. TaxID=1870903 RepID=UPI003A99BEB5